MSLKVPPVDFLPDSRLSLPQQLFYSKAPDVQDQDHIPQRAVSLLLPPYFNPALGSIDLLFATLEASQYTDSFLWLSMRI
jgi:hypothetical protein